MAILKDLIVQGQSNFIGIPTAPTAPSGTSNTQIATTEFVNTLLGGVTASSPWEKGSGSNSAILKGGNNTASGNYSVAEGESTSATSDSSHAEGLNTSASGQYSHAEGFETTASNFSSHAEGTSTSASGYESHAEGYQTTANGTASHAEGYQTTASGGYSHAEGNYTSAMTLYSHAEGLSTKVINQSEHASGRFNISTSASTTFGNSGNTLFSVGNGSSNIKTHNSLEIRQNGDIYIVDVDNGSGDTYDTKGMLRLQDSLFTEDVELTISAALNDLNERKLDASAYTPTDLSNYYTKSEIDDKSEVVSESLNDLNKRVNYAIATAGSVKASTAITSGSSDVVTSDALYRAFYEVENVSSTAINDLNTRLLFFENLFSQAEDNKVLGQVNGEIGWYYINQFTNPT